MLSYCISKSWDIASYINFFSEQKHSVYRVFRIFDGCSSITLVRPYFGKEYQIRVYELKRK